MGANNSQSNKESQNDSKNDSKTAIINVSMSDFARLNHEIKAVSDSKIREVMLRNLQDYQNYYTIEGKKIYEVQNVENINYIDYLQVYKIARIKYQNELSLNTFALVKLLIPKHHLVKNPMGEDVKLSELKTGDKYCAREVCVFGYKICGNPNDISYIEKYKDRIEVVSNFDQDFTYPPGKKIIEPEFGSIGKGCIKGIHFFPDEKSALKYSASGFTVGNSVVQISKTHYEQIGETDYEFLRLFNANKPFVFDKSSHIFGTWYFQRNVC
jgi:hypothetical protein